MPTRRSGEKTSNNTTKKKYSVVDTVRKPLRSLNQGRANERRRDEERRKLAEERRIHATIRAISLGLPVTWKSGKLYAGGRTRKHGCRPRRHRQTRSRHRQTQRRY